MADKIPLLMGDSVVGHIALDLDSGDFTGSVDPKFTHILRDGIANKLLSVSFMARPGNPRSLRTKEEVAAMQDQHEQVQSYLEDHREH